MQKFTRQCNRECTSATRI